jgi:hypothetical protein
MLLYYTYTPPALARLKRKGEARLTFNSARLLLIFVPPTTMVTMTSSLTSTPSQFAGPTAPIPDDNIFNFCFSNPFQHTPNNYISKTSGKSPPEHTFDGLIIPPQRPCIIHAGTGATLSWQRARADSLRVARYFHAIAGDELPWDGKQNLTPVSARNPEY